MVLGPWRTPTSIKIRVRLRAHAAIKFHFLFPKTESSSVISFDNPIGRSLLGLTASGKRRSRSPVRERGREARPAEQKFPSVVFSDSLQEPPFPADSFADLTPQEFAARVAELKALAQLAEARRETAEERVERIGEEFKRTVQNLPSKKGMTERGAAYRAMKEAEKAWKAAGGKSRKKQVKKKVKRRFYGKRAGMNRGWRFSVPNATVYSGAGGYRQPRYTQARRSKPRTSRMGTQWGEAIGDAISGFIPGIGGTIAKGPLHTLG